MIQEKEKLLQRLNANKRILNDEMMEYMYELLELEISALDKSNLDNSLNYYLSKLAIFKQLVIYNIYNKSFDLLNDDLKLIDEFNKVKILNNQNKTVYKFDYEKESPTVILYQTKKLKPIGQRKQEIREKISVLEDQLKIELDEKYPCQRLDGFIEQPVMNTTWYINKYQKIDDLKKEIRYLKSMLKEDVEFKFLDDADTINSRNEVLNKFLEINNLDMNEDFETQIISYKQKPIKRKIKKYDFANIIIK